MDQISKEKNKLEFLKEDKQMIAENIHQCEEDIDNCCMVKIYSKSDFQDEELDNYLKILHYIKDNCKNHPNLINIFFIQFRQKSIITYLQEFMYQMAMTIRFLQYYFITSRLRKRCSPYRKRSEYLQNYGLQICIFLQKRKQFYNIITQSKGCGI